MTMIDHEGEGSRNDHVVTWTKMDIDTLHQIRKILREFSI